MNELGSDNQVAIYPNPSNGQFTVDGINTGMQVELYDYLGRLLTKSAASGSLMRIDLSEHPNGVYLIRILDNNSAMIGEDKLIKTN